ncbi:MAG: DNA translocase FtsK 4TM domain-containing protein [Chitinophagaceae bacterium]|nr:DNA translocase FtsK 4TM domain-containing protein [Chitinophagaceae bacterium]
MAAKKKTSKKKTKRSSGFQPDKSEKVSIKELAKDERSHKIAGTILLLLGVLLCISFLSYLFTWKNDYSMVQKGVSVLWSSGEQNAANWLGTAGAYFSDLFFRRGFGIASFLFCAVFFVLGINLIKGSKYFSVSRNLRYVVVGIFLFSVTASFLTHKVNGEITASDNAEFFWGGRTGDGINEWLHHTIGALGTGLLLFVCFLSYIIWRFNPAFKMNLLNKKQEVESMEEEDEGEEEEEELENEKPVLKPLRNKKDVDSGPVVLIEKGAEPKLKVVEPEEPFVPIPKEISGGSGLPLEVKNADAINKAGQEGNAIEKDDKVTTKPYDPIIDLPNYKYPTLNLLETHGSDRIIQDAAELEDNKIKIEETLRNYDIGIQKIYATVGPTVTLYEIIPDPGVRISKIRNLEDDIALSLAALGIRIIAPIPGKGTIGIEVPNMKKTIVSMRTLLGSEKFKTSKFQLPIALGKKIDNENFIVDLTSMPHLLMAGATGQGKSVGLNAILVSLLYKKHPSQVKFVLIDPKKVELSIYTKIEKHFLAKLPGEEDAIITDTKKVIHTLNALCTLMDIRYDLMKEAGARNIKEYNEKFVSRRLNPEKGHKYMPFVILVIDEFADLIMTAGKEVEMPIARLAQLARAVGIHLIIATQRPSVNIITGVIKANFPARIAFKVSSKIDSRTILDVGGAEQLIGKGDMLISYNGELTRVQCAFVDTPEVDAINDFIGNQKGYPDTFELPEYEDEKEFENKSIDAADRDPRFKEAALLIVRSQSGSTSLLQRKMQLGYNRAGRLMDQLEDAGIVGPSQGSKPRDVLISTEQELDALFI